MKPIQMAGPSITDIEKSTVADMMDNGWDNYDYVEKFERDQKIQLNNFSEVCCFDKFIEDLPIKYKETIELVYLNGKKQSEAAKILEISLANVKARIRRAKKMLQEKFHTCCKFEFDKNGNLVGESDCPTCQF